jgi:hypothetical protein
LGENEKEILAWLDGVEGLDATDGLKAADDFQEARALR